MKGAEEPAIAPGAPEDIAKGVVEADVTGGVSGVEAGVSGSTEAPILTTPFGSIEETEGTAALTAEASAAAIARVISGFELSVFELPVLEVVGAAGGFCWAIAGRSASDKFLLTMIDLETDSEAVRPWAKSVGVSSVALCERQFEPEGG